MNKIASMINFEKTFLLNYKKLNLTDDEALVLLITYSLVSSGTKFVNPTDLELLCGFSSTKIDVVYSSLTNKNYISTEILDDGSVVTSFDYITEKLLKLLQGEQEKISSLKQDKEEDNLFDYMEKFFGRLLSPLEYEVIQSWKNKKYSYKLVKAACEIAQASNNKSIRYIDSILFEETKKIELGPEEYSRREQETVELSQVDWLNK